MKQMLVTLMMVSFALQPSAVRAAPDEDARSAVIALANQVVDAFNKGDVATVKSLMPAESIVDENPPYIWQGPSAVDAWLAAADQYTSRMKMTDQVVRIGPPTYIQVEGDSAYAVFPEHFGYKRAGVQVNEEATLTAVARKTANGWRIVSATYAAPAH
jgi:ketosteroid isomerase-like protein